MLINDIDSKQLLPEWALNLSWIQSVFDVLVKLCVDRLPVIDAPLTLDAIQHLTDQELQTWYERFGVVEYYPDLTRETREQMLYWLSRFYRCLGTPDAVRQLCKYIYDGDEIIVDIKDNLAWNGTTLEDEELLNLFDIFIEAAHTQLSISAFNRIISNVLRIARNSQTLRDVVIRYSDDLDVPCSAVACGAEVVYRVSDDDSVAVLPPMPVNIVYLRNMNRQTATIVPGNTWRCVNENNTEIPYDDSKIYTGIRYYTSDNDFTGTVINNDRESGVYLGRYSTGILMIGNNTSADIHVQRLKYEVSDSEIVYYLGYMRGRRDSMATIVPGNYWRVVDGNNNEVQYNDSKVYIGIRYYTRANDIAGTEINNNKTNGVYLDRHETGVLMIVNNTGSDIRVQRLLYVMQDPEPEPEPTYIDAYTTKNKNYNRTYSNYDGVDVWNDSGSYLIKDKTKYYEIKKTFTYSDGEYVENEYEYGDNCFFVAINSGNASYSELAYNTLNISYRSNNSTTATVCKFSLSCDPIPFVCVAVLSPEKSSVTFSGTTRLYDLDGNLIPYDASKNYAYIESFVQFEGSWGWWAQNLFTFVNDDGYLALYSASTRNVRTVIFAVGIGVHVARFNSSGGYFSPSVNKTNAGFDIYENGSSKNYDSSKTYTLHYVDSYHSGEYSHITAQQLFKQGLVTVDNKNGKLALWFNLSGTNYNYYSRVNYAIYTIS